MGYSAEFTVMDAKRAFCHGSTGSLTNQHIIKDHMISHYKRIYSAKAAVDCTTPTSMCRNVKYIDQKRREQQKKDMSERTQSESSLSQRSMRLNTMASHSSKNTRPSVRGEESPYLGTSVMSSPRFNTSFHCKQIVYSSQLAASSQNCRPASELSYRSPNSQWHHFTQSSSTSASQKKFQSFQDPTQKTYSGDILQKHAHRFTQEKPFTPRTLKSDCKSTLSAYRYYTPPRKGIKEKTSSKFHRQETYHGSTHSKRGSSAGQDSPQPYSLNHEWSDEESNVLRHYSSRHKFRDNDFLLSSSRVSPEGMRSPIMRKVTAEEEELMYLEFISDVTNEIIARGIYSDRVLERVFKRHIDMNRHRLDEEKMRHLLDVLQNDLQSPPAAPVMAIEKRDRDTSLLPRHKYFSLGQELTLETTDDCLLPSMTFDKNTEDLGVSPSLCSTPVNRSISESAGPAREEHEHNSIDLELDCKEGNAVSTNLDNHEIEEASRHHNSAHNDELVKQVDELGRYMAESLSVSEAHNSPEFIEQDSAVKLSDDEF